MAKFPEKSATFTLMLGFQFFQVLVENKLGHKTNMLECQFNILQHDVENRVRFKVWVRLYNFLWFWGINNLKSKSRFCFLSFYGDIAKSSFWQLSNVNFWWPVRCIFKQPILRKIIEFVSNKCRDHQTICFHDSPQFRNALIQIRPKIVTVYMEQPRSKKLSLYGSSITLPKWISSSCLSMEDLKFFLARWTYYRQKS